MKRSAELLYALDDIPPLHLVLLSGAQHVGMIAINLIYPLFVFRAANASIAAVSELLAIGMLVLGIGSLLQTYRLGPFGSGYMLPVTFTATYFAPSLAAAKAGGLSLVFGMTIVAGLFEAALAPALRRMRAIFPPEISGLVIFMIGISASIAGLRTLLDDGAAPVDDMEWIVAGITLGTMVALNIWGTGIAHMLCALVGLVVGYGIAAMTDVLNPEELTAIRAAPWFGIPSVGFARWSFDATFVIPFVIAGVAATMKAMGTITLCQRMNDAAWVRPDMTSATRGVLSDGASTVIAGLAGAVGTNTAITSVGVAAATGVASRTIAYAAAAIFMCLAFMPKFAAALAVMPRPVIVAALVFTVTFILINGVQVMTSRMFDARRTLVIGLSMVAGTAVEVFPIIAASAPSALLPIVGSSLVFASLIALVLNLLFRIGVREILTLKLEATAWDSEAIEQSVLRQGATWGARPDVVSHAAWATCQVVEAVADACWRTGTLQVDVSFDEYNIDVRISYTGALLPFPTQRPSLDQIVDEEAGARMLAGYTLRHVADRVSADVQAGQAVLRLHFEH